MTALRTAGIDTVVSLLEPDEAADLGLEREQEVEAATGLGFVSLLIPDRGVPSTPYPAAFLAAELEDALGKGKNVAIHCRQSVGRSGLMVVAVLTASGAEPGRAIEIVSAARGQAVPETAEQREWLLRLPARVSF